MSMDDMIGIVGVMLAICGAALTAIPDASIARKGFVCYVLADLPLFAYACLRGDVKLACMYGAFILLALLGAYLRTNHGQRCYSKLNNR
jgi:hypothetical protein